MALGVTLPHSLYFYSFDGLGVLRDGETEFKVHSDLRALLCALGRYQGAKHVLYTFGVLREHGSAGVKRSGSHLLYWHNLFIYFIR
jgi:hypothetical protein